ncbi:acyltransferase family protein [Prevotella sp. MA2016]|uniref:acyltransferase family protein n=1 Tax=Prevotella sp. MA2016 TaxID=1408310 RepID=UPI0021012E64|nr:acyltransferase family protein [Prevotella sp. MA2016]
MTPYFLWSIIKFLFAGGFTINRMLDSVLYPDTSFWFLWVLFWIWLIFTLGQNVSKLICVDELIVLLVMSILLMGGMALYELRYFGFQFIAYYFIFYILGYMLNRFDLLASLNDKLVLLFFLIWLCLAWGWNMHSLPSWIPSFPYVPSSLVQYSYRGITATFAIIVLLYYCPQILIRTCGFHRLIAWSGKVSLGIYVVHLILLGFVTGFLQSLDFSMGSMIYIVISALLVYLLSIVFVYVLMKNKYAARYLLGKI